MCRWVAYTGPQIYLQELVTEPDHSLVEQSLHAAEGKTITNGDGFGIGWYDQRPQPGLLRETMPAWNNRNLQSLTYQVQSRLFFAHVRASTGTETTRANCHPFSCGKWMFMHNGQISHYPELRRQLENQLSDQYYQQRYGTTDSELIFLHLLSNGFADNPLKAAQVTIQNIESLVTSTGHINIRLTAAISDGNSLWAMRYATRKQPPGLYWSQHGQGQVVVSEPYACDLANWHEVAPNSLLTVSPGHEPQVSRLLDS
ncbi:MAG: class II glutamine amidotransferase [Gammaproteobacteria bacterium]|jgi:glutamine amidotransferase|nr:class II glutamine amidotransferase [Gammaproteobacteria bacterium]